MIRRTVGAITSILLAFSAVPAVANFEDEQFAKPNKFEIGHHGILIEESTDTLLKFPRLQAFQAGPQPPLACDSLSDKNCETARSYVFNAPFAICNSAAQFDCIESLSFSSSSTISPATFVRYVYSDHPNAFSGDNKLLPTQIGSPSVWRVPSAPHAFGDLYLVIAGHSGALANGRFSEKRLYTQVIPVSEKFGAWDGVIDGNGFGVIGQCNSKLNSAGLLEIIGCGSGAQDFGLFRCAIWEQNGTCLLQRAHRLDTAITVGIRLSGEPSGWLHGRIQNPEVKITQAGSFSKLEVKASPVRVPILYHGGDFSALPPELKSYWDACMLDRNCNVSTRRAGSNPKLEPNGLLRNVQFNPAPYGAPALKAVSVFAPHVRDTSVAAPTAWGFRTLDFSAEGSVGRCAQSFNGTVGIVTTNATAYSEGPPELKGGSLNYSVAGLHHMPDGKTLTLGTYDLIMKSDFARCVYGFSRAPIQASVSVTSVEGDSLVATTEVSERDGWLKLAAYGFTFSEKEIRVSLTQAASPNPQTLNLPRFQGTITRLTSLQRASIQDFVATSTATTTVTCTAMFVSSADRARALARAKAACSAAKEANRDYLVKATVQQTKSRGLDGRVVLRSR